MDKDEESIVQVVGISTAHNHNITYGSEKTLGLE